MFIPGLLGKYFVMFIPISYLAPPITTEMAVTALTFTLFLGESSFTYRGSKIRCPRGKKIFNASKTVVFVQITFKFLHNIFYLSHT